MRFLITALCAALVSIVAPTMHSSSVRAHCQVPCGIYDDAARLQAMREDAATIRKAVVKATELSKNLKKNINQVSRWIATKEQHATRIITTVAEYFLTQKLKPVSPKEAGYSEYLERLAVHHRVMRWAMKNKQQLDLGTVSKLDSAIEDLAKVWTPSK